jgi:DNA transposition AAA+ family ATPase
MNLKQMLQELQDWGLTQAQIGEGIERSQSTVSDLLAGPKRPTYETAEAVRKFYEKNLKQRQRAA